MQSALLCSVSAERYNIIIIYYNGNNNYDDNSIYNIYTNYGTYIRVSGARADTCASPKERASINYHRGRYLRL